MSDTTANDRRGMCRACHFFEMNPAAIERGLPGIASLSSAQGASRSGDGLCTLHDRYLRQTASCALFMRRE